MNREDVDKTSEILTALLEFYDLDEAETWLTLPHKMLGGEIARDVILRGEYDRVWQIIDQIRSGAYI